MKIFLDTAPLIYLIEGNPHFAERAEQQISQWLSSDAILTTSTLTLMELLIVPKKQKDNRLVHKYRALLQEMLSEPMIELNQNIAETAAEIRATYGYKTPDSIQLASAVHTGSDIFYTNNLRLNQFHELKILTMKTEQM